jgi:hypothetical protein
MRLCCEHAAAPVYPSQRAIQIGETARRWVRASPSGAGPARPHDGSTSAYATSAAAPRNRPQSMAAIWPASPRQIRTGANGCGCAHVCDFHGEHRTSAASPSRCLPTCGARAPQVPCTCGVSHARRGHLPWGNCAMVRCPQVKAPKPLRDGPPTERDDRSSASTQKHERYRGDALDVWCEAHCRPTVQATTVDLVMPNTSFSNS